VVVEMVVGWAAVVAALVTMVVAWVAMEGAFQVETSVGGEMVAVVGA